jgi:hypothetical protein
MTDEEGFEDSDFIQTVTKPGTIIVGSLFLIVFRMDNLSLDDHNHLNSWNVSVLEISPLN